MIVAQSRVRVRPDDPRYYEMMNVTDGLLVGTVVTFYEPAPFSHDKRVRWCVRLDNNHYGLFYEHELLEVKDDLGSPPVTVQPRQGTPGGPLQTSLEEAG